MIRADPEIYFEINNIQISPKTFYDLLYQVQMRRHNFFLNNTIPSQMPQRPTKLNFVSAVTADVPDV